MNNETITAYIRDKQQEMIDFRRDLHRHPELSWEEHRTTGKVAEALDRLGIPYRLTSPVGIIAEIRGVSGGKTLALRADMDALSVQELNDTLDYKSCVPGKMHACGHDSHTAMLVTAAGALNAVRHQFSGNIRLIFQPAEEVAEGAREMINQGALDNVDSIFGLHIMSTMFSGTVSCIPGPSFAACDILRVYFRGRGGHGSMPEACVDASVVASAFVMNLQAIVARETSPLESVVVTIGKITAGTRFNVIAENAVLEGTVRCFSAETRERVKSALERYATHTAAMYGADARMDYLYATPPLINDTSCAALVRSVVQDMSCVKKMTEEKPTTAGEDFSFYLEHVSGCFALVGCGNEQKGTTVAHHHGDFNIDEEVMLTGAELYAQYACSYLNQDQNPPGYG
ncbi:amidohydrolase [Salmonella enterica]|nr:amidohydrolase [Salmonella enterica]